MNINDDQYRDTLVKLLKRQLRAEMTATVMYGRAVDVAPTYRDRLLAAKLAYEESRHVGGIASILEDLGEDVETYMLATPEIYAGNFPGIMGVDVTALAGGRPFPPSWTAVMVSLFLADRAAVHQLSQYESNSYGPWAAVMEYVLEDEAGEGGHRDIGEAAVRQLAARPETRQELQAWIDVFMPASLKLMGVPDQAIDDYCRSVGLKRKTSAEVQIEFLSMVLPIFEDISLTVPNLAGSGIKLTDDSKRALRESSAYPHQI